MNTCSKKKRKTWLKPKQTPTRAQDINKQLLLMLIYIYLWYPRAFFGLCRKCSSSIFKVFVINGAEGNNNNHSINGSISLRAVPKSSFSIG